MKLATKLWEIYNGDETFISCANCSFKFLMELYNKNSISVMPMYDKNYKDEASGITAQEDFFNEHSLDNCETEHFCSGCNINLDEGN